MDSAPGLVATANEVKMAKSRGFWAGFVVAAIVVGYIAYDLGHSAGWDAAMAACNGHIC